MNTEAMLEKEFSSKRKGLDISGLSFKPMCNVIWLVSCAKIKTGSKMDEKQ